MEEGRVEEKMSRSREREVKEGRQGEGRKGRREEKKVKEGR
jgi:hypothetical protein